MAQNINKLPVWATFKESYRLAWNNYGYFFKISRLWLLVGLPVLAAYYWFTILILKNTTCMNVPALSSMGPHARASAFFHSMLADMPASLFLLLIVASIAVPWHRLILLNEKTENKFCFRLDKLVWNYFGLAVSLVVLLPLPVSFVSLAMRGAIGALMGCILVLVSFYVMTRLTVMLPAKALALSDVSVKDVWRKTRSNFWRLFAGYCLCYLPAWAIAMFTSVGSLHRMTCGLDAMSVTAYVFHEILYILVVCPVGLTFLSLSFKFFFEGDEGSRQAAS